MTEFRTNDLFYWFAIHRAYRLESAGFAVLEEGFPSMEAAWKGTASELSAAGLDESSVSGLLKIQAATTPEAEMERFAENGVEAILRPDSRYPARLREIPDAPPVLYLKGSWEPKDDWSVAVVGTRRAATYGREAPANSWVPSPRTASQSSPDWRGESTPSRTTPHSKQADAPSRSSRTAGTRSVRPRTAVSRTASSSTAH